MDFNTIEPAAIFDMFLLLLIGIGPKIALVPFLEATVDLPMATKARIVRKMLITATGIALVLHHIWGGVDEVVAFLD